MHSQLRRSTLSWAVTGGVGRSRVHQSMHFPHPPWSTVVSTLTPRENSEAGKELKISFRHSRFYIGWIQLRPDIAGCRCHGTSEFVPDYNGGKCKNVLLFWPVFSDL